MSPIKKKFALRLEDRLIILVVALIITIMIAVTIVTIKREQQGMELEIRNRVKAHSDFLATLTPEQLLKRDYIALQSVVDEVIKRDPDIAYVAIYDEDGRTLARCRSTTLSEKTFQSVDRLLKESIKITLASKIERIQIGGKEILYDTIVPIKVPELKVAPVGAVRIGFTTARIKEKAKDIRDQNIVLTVIFACLGMVGALVMGKMLNRQISEEIAARAAPVREEVMPGREYDLEKGLKMEYGERFDEAYKKLSPQELFALFKAAREIPTVLSLKEALRLSAQTISDIMKVSELIIFLKGEKTRELKARMGYDMSGPMSEEALADIKVKEGRGEVWMASEFGTSSLIDTPKPGSGIVSPLVSKGKTIGVIEIRNRLSGESFQERDQLLLELLGSLVATSLDKAQAIEERK
ncbi:GAF domain-containing protein [bacterium]|nr:GAF domain-containing protein [bacterium]